MRDGGNIHAVEQSGADWMGFIFYPRSPRYMKYPPSYMPRIQKRVGVFVNSDIDEVTYKAHAYGLDYIQLHGDETPDYCAALRARGLRIIRALSVASEEDLRRAALYPMADFLLFDTPTESYGGSGKRFRWDQLRSYRGPQPFLLSGGLSPDALPALRAFSHPLCMGIDLNSGFETAPAVKDAAAIARFIKSIKHNA